MVDKTQAEELFKQGFTYEEIGETFKVSRQRIHQILKNYKHSGRKGRLKKYNYRNRNWGECRDCKVNVAEILHHIDFINSHDGVYNLVALCKACHIKRHKAHKEKLKLASF